MKNATFWLVLLAALVAPSIAAAGTQSTSTPTVSTNPVAGAPVTLTEAGTSDPSSMLTVTAQLGGTGCAAGAPVVDSTTVAGSFVHATTFTPPAPGTYLICYLFSGANGAQTQSFSIIVAPAPPPSSPTPAPTPATAATKCVTPQLLRHTEAYAEHLLTKANCKLGRVYLPGQRTLARARQHNHGRLPKLIVMSQTPRKVGTVSYKGAVVAIRLGVAPLAGSAAAARS